MLKLPYADCPLCGRIYRNATSDPKHLCTTPKQIAKQRPQPQSVPPTVTPAILRDAVRLLEIHAPPSEAETSAVIALEDMALWLETNGEAPIYRTAMTAPLAPVIPPFPPNYYPGSPPRSLTPAPDTPDR